MYQSQQFHTSNYRGDQQGHDSYLRSDSPSPSSLGSQTVASQYRGFQKPFQPTGFVNSVYGQTTGTGLSPSSAGYNTAGSNLGTQPQSYHTANYRGDQQGHDSYLRSDASQPSQSQFGGISGYQQTGFTPTYNTVGSSGLSNAQFVSPESFHTANYRGNQQGHDSYLRSDASQPSQRSFPLSSSGTGFGHVNTGNFSNVNNNIGVSTFGTSSIGAGSTSSNVGSPFFGASNLGTYGAAGTASYNQNLNQNQSQFVSPESYHTANYRGNQQGHDSYLRSDASQPSQSQFGTSASGSSFGSYNTNRF